LTTTTDALQAIQQTYSLLLTYLQSVVYNVSYIRIRYRTLSRRKQSFVFTQLTYHAKYWKSTTVYVVTVWHPNPFHAGMYISE